MRTGGVLLWAALLGGSPTTDDLVSRLGSPRYADREAASGELLARGRSAIPALRRGEDSSDLEIRTRAKRLLERIEGDLLVEPTLVELDFRGVRVGEVAARLSDRTGLKVVLDPESSGSAGRAIDLTSDDPISFWEAIARLGDAAELDAATAPAEVAGSSDDRVVLFERSRGHSAPTSIRGPFRTRVLGLTYQHELNYESRIPGALAADPIRIGRDAPEGEPAFPAENRQFSIRFVLAAEPRMILVQNGGASIVEARDDRGQSLLLGARPGATIESALLELNASNSLRFQVDLSRPVEPGRKIARLRGRVPVSVWSRKSDPLEAAIADGVGRRVAKGGTRLTVDGFQPLPETTQYRIDLTLFEPGETRRGKPTEVGSNDVDESFRLEILDARGRIIPWFLAGTTSVGNESRMSVVTLPIRDAGAPASIRRYQTNARSTEVEFEFRDLPMP
jgi:hypothetical protein